MLEPPDIAPARLAAALQSAYGLQVRQLDFLPLGADVNTAVYRVVTHDHLRYFLKARRGAFSAPSVTVPNHLREQGVQHLIPVLPCRDGGLWTTVGAFRLVLAPFVEGRNAYEVALSDLHWLEFGATLRRIHEVTPPTSLLQQLPRETYADRWRTQVKALLEQDGGGLDPVAGDAVRFLRSKRDDLLQLVGRTETLAARLEAQDFELRVCHADLHAGNLLLGNDGGFHLVDWDTLVLAPRERDLMFIGAGLLGGHAQPEEERALFFRGYGEAEVSGSALAYFRYERIIQDIASFGEELLSGRGGDEDRAQSLGFLRANFRPGGTIDLASRAERAGR